MSNYDHVPRPNVERHYHIRDLIEAQEKRSEDRQRFRDRERENQERNALIKDNKIFCKCDEEFKSMTIKEVETDWTCSTQNIAFYRAKCPKNHWCIRFITDKFK